MKRIYNTKCFLPFAALFFTMFLLHLSLSTYAQIENLYVETYYIADANDATDTTEGRSLTAGMKTYRIYLDLAPGSKIKQIFGSDIHPLRISSTSDFYNNIDRPNSPFGFQMNKSWFDDNPTIALDSWLSIGLAASGQMGVVKDADNNGVLSEILNNTGGTAAVPGGLLRNTDSAMGLPLTSADGLLPNANTLGQWLDVGFKDLSGDDTTIFGHLYTGSEFLSYDAMLQQTNGIEGADNDNKVLIAQLTTLGDLSFELNVVIDEWDGSGYTAVTYVANGDSLISGQFVSPFLSYPSVCGCTDPDYIEYSNIYACSVQDSCKNLVVFGCMDPLACNYDPAANYNLPTLCCYPGFCNDLDLTEVCPITTVERFGIQNMHPNPAKDLVHLQVTNKTESPVILTIFDQFGRKVNEMEFGIVEGVTNIPLDVSMLSTGMYHLMMNNGTDSENLKLMIAK